jgi:hypothetical protein
MVKIHIKDLGRAYADDAGSSSFETMNCLRLAGGRRDNRTAAVCNSRGIVVNSDTVIGRAILRDSWSADIGVSAITSSEFK